MNPKTMTQQDQAFLTRLVASARLAEGPLAEPDVGPKEKKTATAIESTYATLRDRILRGSHPQGSRLHLETLKSSLGVSGSTLREALTRLIGDRLVVAEGQKGFKVAPMSLCDLDDLTSARITLETTAIVESINLGGGDWEDQLVISFRRLARAQERVEANPGEAFDAWEARNQEFHNALMAASPSKWLANFREILFHNSERYRRLSGTQGPIPVEVHEEHKTIFEAAIARDANQAVLVLSQHIRRSANVIRANGLLREA
ncbi:FCD domain-containing protein [Ideonella sp. B7]|jgi:DNA-binding GntR family transcriptional regulator|uniref:GntR family transcriptional regulator n=1 Tax=Ideonella benzenivorans TaxID=2831643 RepID=UPI001CEC76FB|nr:FCD domain-containing protein [Ideonella benzenivorans]MCA6216963.1 FCD domain-containing protein [Ideonella benzenivorans]